MLTSYKAMVWYHNQDIDIDAVKIQNIFITTGIPPAVFESQTHSHPLTPHLHNHLLNPWQPFLSMFPLSISMYVGNVI